MQAADIRLLVIISMLTTSVLTMALALRMTHLITWILPLKLPHLSVTRLHCVLFHLLLRTKLIVLRLSFRLGDISIGLILDSVTRCIFTFGLLSVILGRTVQCFHDKVQNSLPASKFLQLVSNNLHNKLSVHT